MTAKKKNVTTAPKQTQKKPAAKPQINEGFFINSQVQNLESLKATAKQFENSDGRCFLIGMTADKDGKTVIDKKAELVAVITPESGVILKSKHCIPANKADISMTGENLAYCFAPEIMGDSFERTHEIMPL